MSELLNHLLAIDYIPHGHCYRWQTNLVWLHVSSDSLIALAYFWIPVMLLYFVSNRRDVPFSWIFMLFTLFIVLCGMTHLLEVWTLWHPHYWLSGSVKAVTAMVSLFTAAELFPLIPKALALPSPAQLEAANRALEQEIEERKQIEQELRQYKQHLQDLVDRRTAELANANQQLQLEIAKRRKSQARLAQLLAEVKSANQELNDFAHIISHDLKAPLRGISNLVDWLLEDYSDRLDNAGQEMLIKLARKTHLLQNLIDGVLQYSMVGRLKEENVEIDLNLLLPEAIALVSPPDNIKIVIETELPTLQAERTRILQLFQNLLSNAIKYIDKQQGKVRVGCRRASSQIEFWIADNGRGVEEKYFNRIFQIFQKLPSNNHSESSGIGLTIVKKIVELYGGEIWLNSALGQGTTFFFTLPKAIKFEQNGVSESR